MAWALRSRIHAAFLTPDGLPEKTLFELWMNDALARFEGEHNITGTPFYNNTMWTYGRQRGLPEVNTLEANPILAPSPLRHWAMMGTTTDTNWLNDSLVYGSAGPWQQNFILIALGRAKELGYPSGPMLSWAGQHLILELTDPNYNYFLASAYVEPTVKEPGTSGGWFDSWTSMKNAFQPAYQTLNSWIDRNVPEHSYCYIALAAASFVKDEPGGAAAWNLISGQLLGDSVLNDTPKWALVPRASSLRGLVGKAAVTGKAALQ